MFVFNALFQLCQDVAKLGVIHHHAIVQIYVQGMGSGFVQTHIVLAAFFQLLVEILQLLAFRAAQFGLTRHEGIYLRLQPFDVGQQVLVAHLAYGVGVYAVHIDQGLERTLLRSEQLVDGAVLIHLLVVFPEVLGQVVGERLAQGSFHAVQVGCLPFCA